MNRDVMQRTCLLNIAGNVPCNPRNGNSFMLLSPVYVVRCKGQSN